MKVDALDVAILRHLVAKPRAGIRECARALGAARGTIHARLGRLERSGVIPDFAPILSLSELGYHTLAFVHVHIAQGRLDTVSRGLMAIPEVIEVHSIAGEGDFLCRVVARDTEHLEQVIQRFVSIPGIVRTRSEVAMSERVRLRVAPLLEHLATEMNAKSVNSVHDEP